ncbi:alpha/beta hydrolase [Nocardioides sp. 31GB23]|uniref:alpha/beta fold hydrolase n=1 Tax=Nocardioides sp. 31GB23 TaxID=3156065 RepID=UPI0032AF1EF0
MTEGPTSGFVDVDGLRLHHLEWSPDGPDPVVLVHGINVQAHTWDPIAAELAKTRRVVAVDLRGHGESGWTLEGYGIDSFVHDLSAVLDSLGIETVDLVGHSLGGRVTIAFAGEHPGRVTRMALSDTGPEVARGGGEFSRDIVSSTQDVRGFRDRAQARAHYAKLHPEWQPVFLDLHAEHQLRQNWAGKLVFRSDPELFWLTGSAGRRENPYLWEMCTRVTAPVLVMRGTRSPFLDDDIAGRMIDAFPRAELCRIEAGHYIPREVPDEFTAALLAFLQTPLP